MTTDASAPIAVIGTGYVGLVTAAGFAELGTEVWCVDVDADKIDRLNRGEIPIYEPGLAESIDRSRSRLHFSTELAPALEHARLLFVAVGTPPTYSGDADLSAVHAVVDAMPASDHHALVMKSTVPVGTGSSIKRIFAEHGKSGFAYVSCPEFLKEGTALADFLKPDRVVIGDDGNWAGDAVAELYAPLDAPLVRTDVASAEMVKLAANAFLATKISFINEIANVCEETGADVLEVARGMGLDQRIGKHFLRPGIGFGGSCFPKDVSALKQLAGNSGYHFQLLTAVIEVNELQKRRVVGKLQKHLGSLVGKRIALLGLAFKPDTDDMREASSLVLSARLQADGATVTAYDPVAEEEARKLMPGVGFADSALGAVEDADACVLVTEWKEFASARLGGGRRRDGRLAGRRRSQLSPTGRSCSRRGSGTRGSAGEVQALILAGGEGTRLRPLTSSVPKPVVPLAGRPFISYLIEWLRRHGVDEVILSCGFMADGVRAVLGDGTQLGVRLRYVEEPAPLGTGGALKFAEDLLDDRFLMLNGDQLTDLDLTAQLRQHERTGARATLALMAVEDPSAYGLVRRRDDLSVSGFLEKPNADEIDTNLVNAGVYVLERSVLSEMAAAGTRISIERDVFPRLVDHGLFGYEASGYWMDIGTPRRYLQATYDILDGEIMTEVGRALAASGGVLVGPAQTGPARSTRPR